MPKMNNREYRALVPFTVVSDQEQEKRFDSDYYVEGYAANYEAYPLYEYENETIYERFERSAFDGCDMSDIIMQYDHTGKVLARQRNKTLYVEANDKGLFIAADLGKSEASRGMYEEIANGLVDRMSWAFIPGEWHFDEETRTIVHTKVTKIYDVSAASIPANDTTDIHVRSAVNGVIDRQKQELLERTRTKEKLALKLKLGGF